MEQRIAELKEFADGVKATRSKEYYTLQELADATKTSPEAVYLQVRRQNIPYSKVRDEESGRRIVVLEAEEAKRLIERMFRVEKRSVSKSAEGSK